MSHRIKIIGLGDEGAAGLPPQYVKWIRESEVLVGGERQLGCFPDYPGERITLQGGLADTTARLRSESRSVVILASGDPLFYGIGGYLAGRLPVEIYPAVSSLQLAFARMGEPWQDAYLASVHGRSLQGLAQRLDGKDKAALLTDDTNTPGVIARYLLSYGMSEYRAFVAENLGGPNERTGWYSLEELQDASFSPLNVVILRKMSEAPRWSLGIPDEEFAQRKPDKGLITKREVRILSLAGLNLRPDSMVWDIGTCTGSVAIEAARMAREGQVFAVEKNEADLANAMDNARKFRTDITFLHSKAPEGLETFPDPDAVFIGGSGGELQELLQVVCSRLRPQGSIVLNAATIENLHEAVQAFGRNGYETSILLSQLARSKPILGMNRFEGLNPVYIITARRAETTSKKEGTFQE
ncbi:precorrin-6y C5,15-methyltransferase (decarboxylating) subunit CbiE [Paenibacillus silviterrae]|uniref:precorrin-6y C5,15-methyltransferase (decarboxylating) subunit CbiE n=1 Tax=Paenibacillus silviterrae TaxID=3242194 RepID=UPI0025436006|nr:precorrin-6y C5,15-methyltransferase (decarboxylating) subunit CbiE [Paenibacillus chinjuensis]